MFTFGELRLGFRLGRLVVVSGDWWWVSAKYAGKCYLADNRTSHLLFWLGNEPVPGFPTIQKQSRLPTSNTFDSGSTHISSTLRL